MRCGSEQIFRFPPPDAGGVGMPLFLKKEGTQTVSDKPGPDEETAERETDEGPFLRCANCLHVITSSDERIVMNGSHQHTFANPHGLVFEIGCFKKAPGCGQIGEATDEFSWFKGYQWRVAVCASCLLHLGWQFASSGSFFYGLILGHLVGAGNSPSA